jgi:hypothetical protein
LDIEQFGIGDVSQGVSLSHPRGDAVQVTVGSVVPQGSGLPGRGAVVDGGHGRDRHRAGRGRAVAGGACASPDRPWGLRGGCAAARRVVVALADGPRAGGEVLDIIRGALRLGGRVHEHGRVMAQDLHPALEIGRAVGEGGVGNAAHAAEM